ncbi:MAG: DUF4231 domain-containing protein [Gammaproteobacteria bacterium]|nr:DUF4231 domain-containing protein [Gammaproteobacteria bacterium]
MKPPEEKREIGSIPENERNQYVLQQYKKRIDYYWKSSRTNKNGYKYSRYLVIILGSLVTLITSLVASNVIYNWGLRDFFVILAPVLAATLTIIGGFSQNFHWGSAWREMVLTALELESVYHRLMLTPDEDRDPIAEMDQLHNLVLTEGTSFFDRLVGVSSNDEVLKLDALTKWVTKTKYTEEQESIKQQEK